MDGKQRQQERRGEDTMRIRSRGGYRSGEGAARARHRQQQLFTWPTFLHHKKAWNKGDVRDTRQKMKVLCPGARERTRRERTRRDERRDGTRERGAEAWI